MATVSAPRVGQAATEASQPLHIRVLLDTNLPGLAAHGMLRMRTSATLDQLLEHAAETAQGQVRQMLLLGSVSGAITVQALSCQVWVADSGMAPAYRTLALDQWGDCSLGELAGVPSHPDPSAPPPSMKVRVTLQVQPAEVQLHLQNLQPALTPPLAPSPLEGQQPASLAWAVQSALQHVAQWQEQTADANGDGAVLALMPQASLGSQENGAAGSAGLGNARSGKRRRRDSGQHAGGMGPSGHDGDALVPGSWPAGLPHAANHTQRYPSRLNTPINIVLLPAAWGADAAVVSRNGGPSIANTPVLYQPAALGTQHGLPATRGRAPAGWLGGLGDGNGTPLLFQRGMTPGANGMGARPSGAAVRGTDREMGTPRLGAEERDDASAAAAAGGAAEAAAAAPAAPPKPTSATAVPSVHPHVPLALVGHVLGVRNARSNGQAQAAEQAPLLQQPPPDAAVHVHPVPEQPSVQVAQGSVAMPAASGVPGGAKGKRKQGPAGARGASQVPSIGQEQAADSEAAWAAAGQLTHQLRGLDGPQQPLLGSPAGNQGLAGGSSGAQTSEAEHQPASVGLTVMTGVPMLAGAVDAAAQEQQAGTVALGSQGAAAHMQLQVPTQARATASQGAAQPQSKAPSRTASHVTATATGSQVPRTRLTAPKLLPTRTTPAGDVDHTGVDTQQAEQGTQRLLPALAASTPAATPNRRSELLHQAQQRHQHQQQQQQQQRQRPAATAPLSTAQPSQQTAQMSRSTGADQEHQSASKNQKKKARMMERALAYAERGAAEALAGLGTQQAAVATADGQSQQATGWQPPPTWAQRQQQLEQQQQEQQTNRSGPEAGQGALENDQPQVFTQLPTQALTQAPSQAQTQQQTQALTQPLADAVTAPGEVEQGHGSNGPSKKATTGAAVVTGGEDVATQAATDTGPEASRMQLKQFQRKQRKQLREQQEQMQQQEQQQQQQEEEQQQEPQGGTAVAVAATQGMEQVQPDEEPTLKKKKKKRRFDPAVLEEANGGPGIEGQHACKAMAEEQPRKKKKRLQQEAQEVQEALAVGEQRSAEQGGGTQAGLEGVGEQAPEQRVKGKKGQVKAKSGAGGLEEQAGGQMDVGGEAVEPGQQALPAEPGLEDQPQGKKKKKQENTAGLEEEEGGRVNGDGSAGGEVVQLGEQAVPGEQGVEDQPLGKQANGHGTQQAEEPIPEPGLADQPQGKKRKKKKRIQQQQATQEPSGEQANGEILQQAEKPTYQPGLEDQPQGKQKKHKGKSIQQQQSTQRVDGLQAGGEGTQQVEEPISEQADEGQPTKGKKKKKKENKQLEVDATEAAETQPDVDAPAPVAVAGSGVNGEPGAVASRDGVLKATAVNSEPLAAAEPRAAQAAGAAEPFLTRKQRQALMQQRPQQALEQQGEEQPAPDRPATAAAAAGAAALARAAAAAGAAATAAGEGAPAEAVVAAAAAGAAGAADTGTAPKDLPLTAKQKKEDKRQRRLLRRQQQLHQASDLPPEGRAGGSALQGAGATAQAAEGGTQALQIGTQVQEEPGTQLPVDGTLSSPAEQKLPKNQRRKLRLRQQQEQLQDGPQQEQTQQQAQEQRPDSAAEGPGAAKAAGKKVAAGVVKEGTVKPVVKRTEAAAKGQKGQPFKGREAKGKQESDASGDSSSSEDSEDSGGKAEKGKAEKESSDAGRKSSDARDVSSQKASSSSSSSDSDSSKSSSSSQSEESDTAEEAAGREPPKVATPAAAQKTAPASVKEAAASSSKDTSSSSSRSKDSSSKASSSEASSSEDSSKASDKSDSSASESKDSKADSKSGSKSGDETDNGSSSASEPKDSKADSKSDSKSGAEADSGSGKGAGSESAGHTGRETSSGSGGGGNSESDGSAATEDGSESGTSDSEDDAGPRPQVPQSQDLLALLDGSQSLHAALRKKFNLPPDSDNEDQQDGNNPGAANGGTGAAGAGGKNPPKRGGASQGASQPATAGAKGARKAQGAAAGGAGEGDEGAGIGMRYGELNMDTSAPLPRLVTQLRKLLSDHLKEYISVTRVKRHKPPLQTMRFMPDDRPDWWPHNVEYSAQGLKAGGRMETELLYRRLRTATVELKDTLLKEAQDAD